MSKWGETQTLTDDPGTSNTKDHISPRAPPERRCARLLAPCSSHTHTPEFTAGSGSAVAVLWPCVGGSGRLWAATSQGCSHDQQILADAEIHADGLSDLVPGLFPSTPFGASSARSPGRPSLCPRTNVGCGAQSVRLVRRARRTEAQPTVMSRRWLHDVAPFCPG